MIHAVLCDQRSFREVHFEPDFNIILADRTKESTKKDSRNGLGKSTLLEIIHFCLGAGATKKKGLLVEPLAGWTFTLDATLAGQRMLISRCTSEPGTIVIEADTENWPIKPKRQDGRMRLKVNDWNTVLGWLVFGLPAASVRKVYSPTFRSLISYFIRRGRDAYSGAFEHFRKQLEWDKQVHNAFLLGLAYEDAAEWQRLRDQEKLLTTLKQASQAGLVSSLLGTVGEREAEKVRLEAQSKREEENLRSFKVHPHYREMEDRANRLTEELHRLQNENIADGRLIRFYDDSLREERAPEAADVERMYDEAGIVLPGIVLRRLDEVKTFHSKLLENRRSFLSGEVARLRRMMTERDSVIQSKSDERAEVLSILRTHGALDEYTKLHEAHLATKAKLEDLRASIENLKKFEAGRSAVKIEFETLAQKARNDYEERRVQREEAIRLFNENSQALYNAPGRLVIDVGPKGFRFDVEIERSDSQGIGSMKVFCYDLVLAQRWSRISPSPGLLIHDSTIFDGVDERQVALALERARTEAKERGFQYICTMNSDRVPWSELPKGFVVDPYVRLRLTDATEDGGLLGMRF